MTMRILLITACLANIAFAFGSLPWQPNPMANHFSLNGAPTRFEPPIVTAEAMSVSVGVVAYFLVGFSRVKTVRRIHSFFDSLGIMTLLFLLLFQWKIFQANQIVPPHSNSIVVLYGWVIIAVFINIQLGRLLFRLPKENNEINPL